MKTETQIAEENIEGCGKEHNIEGYICGTNKHRELVWLCRNCDKLSKTHKASCERFLEFVELVKDNISFASDDFGLEDIYKKITDLKQAIKLYENAGI